MCIISWLIEIFGTLCHVFIYVIGIAGIHYIEAITMFIVIPFVHLMNDEDTNKGDVDRGHSKTFGIPLSFKMLSEMIEITYAFKRKEITIGMTIYNFHVINRKRHFKNIPMVDFAEEYHEFLLLSIAFLICHC